MGLFRKTAKADLVVYNCTIYSSVGEKPFFGAVACRDGKITAIGDHGFSGSSNGQRNQIGRSVQAGM